MTPVSTTCPHRDPEPVVSVIVPVFNVAAQIGAAIASLRAQTLTDFEALVIDDGSTDGSAEVARAAIAGDARFSLIRQANQGLSGARNAGIDRARGDWLAFLDGDDRYAPAFLERLVTGAQAAGVDWAASAVLLCHPDGTEVPHSAIHGDPDPAGMGPPLLMLDSARAVARLFPSAWNKVYRRAVFGDLRFPPGTWFEDHEVFWAFAARARGLLHLPEPLYLHSRDRPGQITGADDDRVFHLFGVLDRLRPLVAGFGDGRDGMARLASRLIHERARVLRQPDRRARFLDTAAFWLAAQGMAYTTRGAPDLSRALGLRLAGEVPLSVVIPVPGGAVDGAALHATLTALRAGLPWDGEVVLIGPGAGAAAALAGPLADLGADPGAGLDQARGRFVMLLPPGTQADPARLVEAALAHDAALALGALRVGPHPHDGWLDPQLSPRSPVPVAGAIRPLPPAATLGLHPSSARMVLRRDLLAAIGPLSVPPWHPLAGGELVLRAAMAAGAAVMLPDLVASEGGPHGLPPARRDQALAWAQGLRLPDPAALPADWRLRLALRALRGGLPPVRSLAGLAARLAAAVAIRRRFGAARPGSVADLGTDRVTCALFRLGPARAQKDPAET